MKKGKIAGLLVVLILCLSLLTTGALAITGNGGSGLPYELDFKEIQAPGSANRYIQLTNTDSTLSNSDNFMTNPPSLSYVYGSWNGNTFTITDLTVANGEYVNLSTTLTKSTIADGTLTVKTNNNKIVGGQDGGTGGSTGATLNVDSGVTGATVSGYFKSVIGPVTLDGETFIYGGTPQVTGAANATNAKNLTINGGAASVSGYFDTVTVAYGATLTVTGDTYIGTLTNNGTVTVNGGATLYANGKSVKPTSESRSFGASNAWGTLAQGAYASVTGAWTLAGDVTINGTLSSLVTPNAIYAAIDANDYDVTVTGGEVRLATDVGALSVTGGQAHITAAITADSISVTGGQAHITAAVTADSISVTGGQAHIAAAVTAADISINGGNLKLDAATDAPAFSVSAGGRSIAAPVGGSAITLTKWGELSDCTAILSGEWTLPGGKTATVTGAATVTGDSGTLTVNSDDISVKGSFAALTVNDTFTANVTGDTAVTGTLTLAGNAAISANATLCDGTNSVSPTTTTTIETWGTLPAGTYNDLTGSWTVGADVTINGTACAVTDHSHSGVTLTGGTGDVSVTGGTVNLTGKITGTIYVSGGKVTDTFGGNTIDQTAAGGEVVGNGSTTLNAGENAKSISGDFASVTGSNLTLAGDTTITSVGADGVTITGNGHALTIDAAAGTAYVKGTFSSITTADGVHVTLAGDAVINGGDVGVIGAEGTAYALTLDVTTAHIQGDFKQITVKGGTVTDCEHGADKPNVNITNDATCLIVKGGDVTLNNGGTIKSYGDSQVDAVQVTGGKLTFGTGTGRTEGNVYKISASDSNGTAANNGIKISGGEVFLLDGSVNVTGTASKGVLVSGANAKFHMGNDSNLSIYSSLNNPTVTVMSSGSYGMYVNQGGEAWLHAGEIAFYGESSYGVYVTAQSPTSGSGICHVWANRQYGDVIVSTTPLLYIHGSNDTHSAMYVNAYGKYDIRGRGVLFEEPGDDDTYKDGHYALYIDENAIPASDYPLSGGTFDGKIRLVDGDISSLLAYNHYVRYDGAAAKFGVSDGAWGVRPWSMTNEADILGDVVKLHSDAGAQAIADNGSYKEFLGRQDEFFTVTDAEWELRKQMAGGGDYQIPAGIVRNANTITLDINVFAADADEYTPYWGMGKRQADVDVSGDRTLYLAGRTLTYTGENWAGTSLASLSVINEYVGGDGDVYQTVGVPVGATLSIRDGVLIADGGTDLAADDNEGGYIGTGTVSYVLADNANVTQAVKVGGTLKVCSAQIVAGAGTKSVGVYTSGTTSIGMTNEDNDNQLIDILGGSHAVYIIGGTVNMNGGVVGNIDSSLMYGGGVGIENKAGTLYIRGGIVTGMGAARTGVLTSAATNITGGCIYGVYEADGVNSGTSVSVTDGTTYINIDAAHGVRKSDSSFIGWITGVPEENYKTSDAHHINNVTMTGGNLYVGALAVGDVTNFTRINGKLSCSGGKTVFYDGIVAGETVVTGAEIGAAADGAFTTKFYVEDGDFRTLTVQAAEGVTGYYSANGTNGLSDCVQLHGGRYASIDVTAKTGAGVSASTDDVIGFWSNAYDFNDDGTVDWAKFNHYAAGRTATLNNAGYWVNSKGVTGDRNDSAYWGVAVGTDCIVVHDGAAEFKRWLESDSTAYDGLNGADYKLPCNIWLGDYAVTNMCDPYFHCDSDVTAMLTVGKGEHNLDTYNMGVFGDWDKGLLEIPAGSTLNLTNTATAAKKAYSNLVRNFGTTVGDSEGIIVIGGALTVNSADVTIKAYYDAVYMDSGSVTLNAGTIIGKGYYVADAPNTDEVGDPDGSAGVNMYGGTLDVNGGSILGWGYGIYADDGTITVTDATVIAGNAADTTGYDTATAGIKAICSYGGAVTVENSTLWGYLNGIYYEGADKVSVSDSTVIGAEEVGIYCDTDAGDLSVTDGASISGGNSGIYYAGAGTVGISGSIVTGTAGKGIHCDTDAGDLSVTDGASISGGNDGLFYAGEGKVTVSDSTVIGTSVNGIFCTADAGDLSVTDSASISGGEEGIYYVGAGKVAVADSAVTGTNKAGICFTTGAGDLSVTDSASISGGEEGIYYFGAGKVTVSDSDVTGTANAGIFCTATAGDLSVIGCEVTGKDGISYAGAGEVTLSDSTVTGTASAALLIDNADAKLSVRSGTYKGATYALNVANADTVVISGGTFGDVDSTNGVGVLLTAYETADITGGSFESIATAKSGAKLADIIPFGRLLKATSVSKVGDTTYSAAVPEANKVDADEPGLVITLANLTNQSAIANAGTVTSAKEIKWTDSTEPENPVDYTATATTTWGYAPMFTISAASAPGGGIPAPKPDPVTIVDNKGETSTGSVKSEKNEEGDLEVTASITKDELKKTDSTGVMTAAIRDENGNLRHVPSIVTVDDEGNVAVSFKVPEGAKFVLVSERKSFADAKGKWFEDVVNEMAERLILKGRSDDVFDGEADITRAEFAATLVRALGLPENGDASVFGDVTENAWYFGAVGKAYEVGIVDGRDNGSFDPDTEISRQEAMIMIRRAAALTGLAGENGSLDSFSDADSISEWAIDDVRWSVGSGLVEGNDAGMLCGLDNIKRCEASVITLRLLQKSELVDVRSDV